MYALLLRKHDLWTFHGFTSDEDVTSVGASHDQQAEMFIRENVEKWGPSSTLAVDLSSVRDAAPTRVATPDDPASDVGSYPYAYGRLRTAVELHLDGLIDRDALHRIHAEADAELRAAHPAALGSDVP